MNLMQSICCFFSSRCASGAADPRNAEQGSDVQTRARALLLHLLVPKLPKPKIRVALGLEMPAAGIAASKRAISGRHMICAVHMSSGSARQRTALRQPYSPRN